MESITENIFKYLHRKSFQETQHLYESFHRQGLDLSDMVAIHLLKFPDIVVFAKIDASFYPRTVKVNWFNYYPARRGVTHTHCIEYQPGDDGNVEAYGDGVKTLKSLIGLVYPDANLEGV